MRHLLTILLGCTVLSFGAFTMVGCDEDPIDIFDTTQNDTTNDTNPGDTGNETIAPTQYYAVLIEDSPNYTCSTNQKAHGYDLDAVQLVDPLGTAVGYATDVSGTPGDGLDNCDAADTDKQVLSDATGAPDGTLSTGYVALAGGYVTLEFGAQVELTSGHTINLFEVGNGDCSGCEDEEVRVSLATDLTCTPANAVTCALSLSSAAVGDASIPIP